MIGTVTNYNRYIIKKKSQQQIVLDFPSKINKGNDEKRGNSEEVITTNNYK